MLFFHRFSKGPVQLYPLTLDAKPAKSRFFLKKEVELLIFFCEISGRPLLRGCEQRGEGEAAAGKAPDGAAAAAAA